MHTVAGNEAEAVEVHHGTVRDKMSQERFRNMQKGSEGPTDVDLRKSGVFKSILLNLSPSCFHFVAICPYLSPSCFAPASFPGSCLGGNSGQRWQEMEHLEHRCFHLEMSEYVLGKEICRATQSPKISQASL